MVLNQSYIAPQASCVKKNTAEKLIKFWAEGSLNLECESDFPKKVVGNTPEILFIINFVINLATGCRAQSNTITNQELFCFENGKNIQITQPPSFVIFVIFLEKTSVQNRVFRWWIFFQTISDFRVKAISLWEKNEDFGNFILSFKGSIGKLLGILVTTLKNVINYENS